MERGTLSETRNPDGSEHPAGVELVRLALPRRVFTMSQISYSVDRIAWLFKNRDLIKGLKFVDEPKVLRFFLGRLAPIDDWATKLMKKFRRRFWEIVYKKMYDLVFKVVLYRGDKLTKNVALYIIFMYRGGEVNEKAVSSRRLSKRFC